MLVNFVQDAIVYDASITLLNNGHIRIIRNTKPKIDYRIDYEKSDLYKYSRENENNVINSRVATLYNKLKEYSESHPYVDEGFLSITNEIANVKKVVSDEMRSVYKKMSSLRAYKNIKMRAENNYKRFKSFITLTFDPSKCDFDITDISECNKRLNIYFTYLRKNSENLYYIGVPEYQKNGAVHYHILSSLPLNSFLLPSRKLKMIKSKGKYRSLLYYDLPGWSYGFSNADDISSTSKTLRYITKYITKDTALYELPVGSHRFFSSQSLDRPLIIDIMSHDLDGVDHLLDLLNSETASKSYFSYNDEWKTEIYNYYFDPSLIDSGVLTFDKFREYYKKLGLYVRTRKV